MLGGAALLAALAALTKGPLAAFRVLPPGSHRVLDVMVGVALAVGPLASPAHPSVVAIGLLELSAIVLWRLAYVGIRPLRPAPARVGPAQAGPASARVSPALPRPAPGSAQASSAPPPTQTGSAPAAAQDGPARSSVLAAGARGAGRMSVKVKAKVAGAAPVADELLGRGARRAGTAVGRRSARRAAR